MNQQQLITEIKTLRLQMQQQKKFQEAMRTENSQLQESLATARHELQVAEGYKAELESSRADLHHKLQQAEQQLRHASSNASSDQNMENQLLRRQITCLQQHLMLAERQAASTTQGPQVPSNPDAGRMMQLQRDYDNIANQVKDVTLEASRLQELLRSKDEMIVQLRHAAASANPPAATPGGGDDSGASCSSCSKSRVAADEIRKKLAKEHEEMMEERARFERNLQTVMISKKEADFKTSRHHAMYNKKLQEKDEVIKHLTEKIEELEKDRHSGGGHGGSDEENQHGSANDQNVTDEYQGDENDLQFQLALQQSLVDENEHLMKQCDSANTENCALRNEIEELRLRLNQPNLMSDHQGDGSPADAPTNVSQQLIDPRLQVSSLSDDSTSVPDSMRPSAQDLELVFSSPGSGLDSSSS